MLPPSLRCYSLNPVLLIFLRLLAPRISLGSPQYFIGGSLSSRLVYFCGECSSKSNPVRVLSSGPPRTPPGLSFLMVFFDQVKQASLTLASIIFTISFLILVSDISAPLERHKWLMVCWQNREQI